MSYLALNNMDRLVLYDMKDMSRAFSVGGGRNAFAKVLGWLEKLTFSGETDMLLAARKIRLRGPGVTVIISDFLHQDMLEEAGKGHKEDLAGTGIGKKVSKYEKMLEYLNYCKQRPVILHTLAEEELHITLEGTLNLIDAETEDKLRLTMDARAVDCYEKELAHFIERMKRGCTSDRGAYVLCDTGRDRNQLVFQDLRVIYDI